MADKQYGVVKVSGFTASNYESLTSHFEYVMITTKIPIFTAAQWLGTFTTDTVGAAICQAGLDKLIQIVSLRGQPVIMGNIINTVGGPTSLIPTATPTCQVTMAIEHPNAWGSAATASSVPTFNGPPPGGAGAGWADVRASEDLLNRLKLDGINYGFGATSFNPGTPPFAAINDSTLAVIISTAFPNALP